MKSPLQGTLCLAIGIVGLIGCAIFGLDPPQRETIATAPTITLVTPLVDDSLQTTYWGESRRTEDGTEERISWTVTIYELPRDDRQRRSVIIHSVGQPILGTKWIRGDAESRQRTAVMKQDADGTLHPWLMTTATDFHFFPVDSLLTRQPTLMDAVPKAVDSNTTVYDVSDDTLGVRIVDGQRRLRIAFDETEKRVSSLEMVATWRNSVKPTAYELKLNWGHSSNIAADRVEIMHQDLAVWGAANQRVLNLVYAASRADKLNQDAVKKLYLDHEQALENEVETISDTMLKHAIHQWQAVPEINIQRIIDGALVIQRLRQHPGDQWAAESLDGEKMSWEHQAGKVQVLGFVYRGRNDTVRAMELLSRIRKSFGDSQVFVAAFAADLKIENRWEIEAALSDQMPVFEGVSLFERLELQGCGLPAIIIIDRDGTPQILHTSPASGSDDAIISAIESMLKIDNHTLVGGAINSLDQLNGNSTLRTID